MKTQSEKSGFALATTLVLLAVSLASVTTIMVALGRSLRLTRSHAEGIRAFYIAEAGKEYAMWKLSSSNTDTDAGRLADCLAQTATCPDGLNETWSITLPSDPSSHYTVNVTSDGQEPGMAEISSLGERTEGTATARRRTKISAFKPIRILTENDDVFSYGMATDGLLDVHVRGSLKITTVEGSPIKGGVHSNTDIRQNNDSLLDVDGPVKAVGTVDMGHDPVNPPIKALEYRGEDCGWSGCQSMFSETPKYCWGTGCDGYVGVVSMPGLDIKSSQPDSLLSIANEFKQTYPTKKFIYTANEIEAGLRAARQSGANGGWFETDGPIAYVNGSIDMASGDKLRVHGVLVIDGSLTVGDNRSYPYQNCGRRYTCDPKTEIAVDEDVEINQGAGAVTGLVATGNISLFHDLKSLSINGLIYALGTAEFSCFYNQITTQGAIVARQYINKNSVCNPNHPAIPSHHHIYDFSKLNLLTQGARSIKDITTVYTGHWEEAY